MIRSFLDKLYLQVELSVGGKRFLLSHSFVSSRSWDTQMAGSENSR